MRGKKRKRKGERESESWRNCLEQTRKVYAKDVDGGFNTVYGINDTCGKRVYETGGNLRDIEDITLTSEVVLLRVPISAFVDRVYDKS